MKKRIWFFHFVLVSSYCFSQPNIGVGIDNPTRAKLEVWGVSGNGRTSAIIGDDRAISILRGNPGIGLNLYSDNSNVFRGLSDGYSALWDFKPLLDANVFSLVMFPTGAANTSKIGTTVWDFDAGGRLKIGPNNFNPAARLDVHRGTGVDGTAMFVGTNFHSHINFGTDEHTYIRGGKPSSLVLLNDIPDGKVIIGNGTTTVGINTNNYVPPTTLEVRQSQGGMEITQTPWPDDAWEWRVGNGSITAHYYLYYQGAAKCYFSNVDGAHFQTSDARLKKNFETFELVLDKILQLQVVSYKMKEGDPLQNRLFGFIAQDVQPFFPQLVHQRVESGKNMLFMDYSGFSVIAIKGVQEEQTQIETLAKEISDIELRLQKLEQKLSVKNN